MKKTLLAFVLISALAQSSVCVRNYSSPQNSPCDLFPQSYYLVQSQDGKDVCARGYVEGYCTLYAKEYRHVIAKDGRRFCTVEYNQPTLINLCAQYPQFYAYVNGEG